MEKQTKTFMAFTFGCKVNTYESEAVCEELLRAGYLQVKKAPADIYLVNTCAVTNNAENTCLEKIRSLSKNFPLSKIAVFGCFAQLHPEKIREIPHVQVLVGSDSKDQIAAMLNNIKPVENVKKSLRNAAYEELSISSFSSKIRAFVKIQDGCDNFCSYCIIPQTRGKSRSRKHEDILKEISRLVPLNYKEIVLTGIDMGSYEDGPEYHLEELIEDILQLKNKDFRLRIGSLEASQINDRIISTYASNPRLVPHIHIPLQSGSEKILELMGRKYSLDAFYQLTAKLKSQIKDLALSTDIIVGFPNESEDDFLQTCAFVKKVGFMRLHVFPYSLRPYTKAAYMKDQISRMCSKNRVRVLEGIGQKLAEEYKESYYGRQVHLLIEEELDKVNNMRVFRGYSENYMDLKITSDRDMMGKMLLVKLAPGEYLTDYKEE